MNYLKYIEYSAENLQFFLWFRDYSARWEKLSDAEKALSPEWTGTQVENTHVRASVRPTSKTTHHTTTPRNVGSREDHRKVTTEQFDPIDLAFYSGLFDDKHDNNSGYDSSISDGQTLHDSTVHRGVAEQAFDDAGMKWRPCMFSSHHYSSHQYTY